MKRCAKYLNKTLFGVDGGCYKTVSITYYRPLDRKLKVERRQCASLSLIIIGMKMAPLEDVFTKRKLENWIEWIRKS